MKPLVLRASRLQRLRPPPGASSSMFCSKLRSHCIMITDPLFYLAAAPAVLLMGLSKGGFAGLGLLSLPLLALVVSPVQAAAIMLPILIAQDVVTVWAYRRAWDSGDLAILLPGAALGIGHRRLHPPDPGRPKARLARRARGSLSFHPPPPA